MADIPPEVVSNGTGIAALATALGLLGDRVVRAIKEGQRGDPIAVVRTQVRALEARLDALEKEGTLRGSELSTMREQCKELKAGLASESAARASQHRDYARTLDGIKDKVRDLHVAIAARVNGGP